MRMTKPEFQKRAKQYAERFREVRKAAAAYCVKQDDLIEMGALAVVAKQHALLVGPWGCNKTRTINVFTHLIGATNGQMFRATLDKTTPPEALLGPISPKQLLENDRFVRNLKGTVCDATFAFIGEAFSGNSATRRALHTVLNERYVENGGERVPVQLHTAFLDSNDFPSRREDRPFYDRIALRCEVNYLEPSDKDAFIAMRRSPQFVASKVAPLFTIAEVREAAQLARLVVVPPIIDDSMHMLRNDLFAKAVQLSDRRWYVAYSVLKASALLDGRDHVAPSDLWSLRFVLTDIVDGQAKAVVEQLKPYKGQSLRDAEQSFVNDARILYEQAVQGNTAFRKSAIESLFTLSGSVIDAEIKAEIVGIADKLKDAAKNAPATLELTGDDDSLTDAALDELIGFEKPKTADDEAVGFADGANDEDDGEEEV